MAAGRVPCCVFPPPTTDIRASGRGSGPDVEPAALRRVRGNVGLKPTNNSALANRISSSHFYRVSGIGQSKTVSVTVLFRKPPLPLPEATKQ